jgi:hypothetical protein
MPPFPFWRLFNLRLPQLPVGVVIDGDVALNGGWTGGTCSLLLRAKVPRLTVALLFGIAVGWTCCSHFW